jgi:hypothetical protein
MSLNIISETAAGRISTHPLPTAAFDPRVWWCRLSEQIFRVDKWSVCRG